MTPLLRKISFKNGCFSLPLGDNIIIIFFLVLNQPRKLKRQAPKILCKNPRKIKSLPSGFCRWVYGGHQLLLGPKTKQKGYLSILTKHQRRIFIAKWMQMQHSPRLNQSQLWSPTQASTTWCFFKTFGWDPIMKQFEQHCQRWFITSWVVPQEKYHFVSTCRIEWWLVWGTWHQLSVMGEFFPRRAVGSPLSPGA